VSKWILRANGLLFCLGSLFVVGMSLGVQEVGLAERATLFIVGVAGLTLSLLLFVASR